MLVQLEFSINPDDVEDSSTSIANHGYQVISPEGQEPDIFGHEGRETCPDTGPVDYFGAISMPVKLPNLAPSALADLAKPFEHLGSLILLAVLDAPTFL
ncbi:hypothetical protein ACLD9I_003964 [Pseudomonas aeruginosa]